MLDPKYVRLNLQEVAMILKKKGYCLNVDQLDALEKKRKVLQQTTENLQAERKKNSKMIGQLKANMTDASKFQEIVIRINEDLKIAEKSLRELQVEIDELLNDIPNLPHESVTLGNNDTDNIEVCRWGEPRVFDFQPKDHVDLGEPLGLDFEIATKLSGSRFSLLRGGLTKLYRALMQFMLDVQIKEHGYEEIIVPLLVYDHVLFGTGQLPKFEEDMFKTQCIDDGKSHYLISTAEITLTNIVREQILEASQLPMKFVGCTPCFRREAGSSGRDTRGMLRQHQFDKVELVQVVDPNESWQTLEQMVTHGTTILERLQLPYRVVSLCGGDLGFSAAKTYDIEVWLPGQNKYREVSSMSNCLDFQARRMKARFRSSRKDKKTELVHTLNGSGLAVGRAFIAVLENGQDSKGNILIPEVLRPYMNNLSILMK